MQNPLIDVQPKLVWKYFFEISKIPRPSKYETQISKYVCEIAKKFNLQVKADKFGNLVVKKSASKGKEKLPMICLQGHLDMVCEKNADKNFDFFKDPIELVVKKNILMANGTTLGGDNGIAVATMLAIMEDDSVVHGPMEFLFTVDEETGLTGANNLQKNFIQSKILLNLDSEEEGAIYIGCSGGRDTVGTWKLNTEGIPTTFFKYKLSVLNLKGGHSGLEIDKNRGNAIKILNRILLKFSEIEVRVSSINGGNKRNAIPRECEAIIFVPTKSVSSIQNILNDFGKELNAETLSSDNEIKFSLDLIPKDFKEKGKVLKQNLQTKLLRTISSLPHGVIKTSSDIKNLVETSTNVASITTSEKTISIATSQRSSIASEINEISETVANIFYLGDCETVTSGDGYPGWKPNPNSKILQIAKTSYNSLFKKDIQLKAIHAGLECGIIGEKYPGIDMISFGPTLEGVHSPDEKIYIDTVEKFWKLLLSILKSV